MKKISSLGKVLNRDEAKKIKGGDDYGGYDYGGGGGGCSGSCDYVWTDYQGKKHTTTGTCKTASNGGCYCSSGGGQC